MPFFSLRKKFLGIDIGTNSIKVVELSSLGQRKELRNYGEISASSFFKNSFRNFQKDTLLLSLKEIARGIKAILEEAKIKTKKAGFSVPDFSSFFINFDLPPMTEEELPEAVKYNARQYIPLSLKEVVIDWILVKGIPDTGERLQVLLVAIPKDVIYQYKEIARLCNLELLFLEAEAFSLVRAVAEKEKVETILDIGAQSTTINLVNKGKLIRSYSIDVGGNDLLERISSAFSLNRKESESMMKRIGLLPTKEKVNKILLPTVDIILAEVERIFENFEKTEGEKIEEIIIAGGCALLPGLKEYFFENLKRKVKIANPFREIFYPPILEKKIKNMGPSFSVAVGIALRGFEKL